MGSRTVWIVWNEAMTQGVVLTNSAQAEHLKRGVYDAGDLTEAFANLHGDEILTIDEVTLEVAL